MAKRAIRTKVPEGPLWNESAPFLRSESTFRHLAGPVSQSGRAEVENHRDIVDDGGDPVGLPGSGDVAG